MINVLLPEPDAPVIATSLPSGNSTSTPRRLFSRAPRTVSDCRIALAALLGHGDPTLAGNKLSSRGRFAGDYIVNCSLNNHVAAMNSRARSHLDDVIRGGHRVLIVLDDNYRVADIAQALKRCDHLYVVLGMKTDAWLIEHVEHSH